MLLIYIENDTKELFIPSINLSASTLSFAEFLQDRPTVDELCNHILFSEWRLLGLCLPTITDIDLNIITEETGNIASLALRQTFQLWLKKYPDASRQNVIEALQMKLVGQNRIAVEYESALKNLYGEFLNYNVHCTVCMQGHNIDFDFLLNDIWKDNRKLPVNQCCV